MRSKFLVTFLVVMPLVFPQTTASSLSVENVRTSFVDELAGYIRTQASSGELTKVIQTADKGVLVRIRADVRLGQQATTVVPVVPTPSSSVQVTASTVNLPTVTLPIADIKLSGEGWDAALIAWAQGQQQPGFVCRDFHFLNTGLPDGTISNVGNGSQIYLDSSKQPAGIVLKGDQIPLCLAFAAPPTARKQKLNLQLGGNKFAVK
jgi:hypothetical protein